MFNRASKFWTTIICALVLFSFSACNDFSTASKTTINGNSIITELNKPYKGSIVNIMITEIYAYEQSEFQNATIVFKLIFENVSKNSDYFVNPASCEAYVDNFSAKNNYLVDSHNYEGPLNATISPGKKAEGYWGVDVPKDAAKIEFRIKDDFLNDVYATFILGIPPIEDGHY